MTASNQLMKEEAQRLFDYRDGMLYWRFAASGHRKDGRAISHKKSKVQLGCNIYYARFGGKIFQAHYLVWNWHHGITAKTIRFADGNWRISELKT